MFLVATDSCQTHYAQALPLSFASDEHRLYAKPSPSPRCASRFLHKRRWFRTKRDSKWCDFYFYFFWVNAVVQQRWLKHCERVGTWSIDAWHPSAFHTGHCAALPAIMINCLFSHSAPITEPRKPLHFDAALLNAFLLDQVPTSPTRKSSFLRVRFVGVSLP